MATSFVEYREKGFWCDGAYLKLWLYLFVKEAASERNPFTKHLLDRVLDEWHFMATIGSGSAIELLLDDLIVTKQDKELLLKVSGQLHRKLLSYGIYLPAPLIADANNAIHSFLWEGPVLTTGIMKVSVLFRQLLKGRLTTDASSPLHYLKFTQWHSL